MIPEENKSEDDIETTEEEAVEEQVEEQEDEESVEEEQITITLTEYEELKRAKQEFAEEAMRRQAEFENSRKRIRRDADAAETRAIVRFVRPMLLEMDNFDHALNSGTPDKFQEFAMGVSMIRTNVQNILTTNAVEQIPAEGIFNPAYHEVKEERECEDKPKGHILEVIRMGYKIGDSVIRATQVVVAKEIVVPEEKAEETEKE